jgi:hypothetical protein
MEEKDGGPARNPRGFTFSAFIEWIFERVIDIREGLEAGSIGEKQTGIAP